MDLWPLIDAWFDKSGEVREKFKHYDETTLTGHCIANAYEDCADQLIEIAGARYFA